MALGLAVLVGSVIRTRSVVAAAVVAGAGLVLAAGSQLIVRPHAAGLTPVATIYLVVLSGAVATGVALRLLDGRAQAAAEWTRQVERMELARELHDIVAHHITGILLQAQAGQIVARRDPARAGESLAEIETVGAEALAAMRRMVGLLRDEGDSDPLRTERLDELVERFGRQGPAVTLSMPSGTRWPPEVESTVYRIVQESLTNVLRHSPGARAVSVAVGQDGHCVVVEVVDDAPQNMVRPNVRGGYGLVGMRERVEALGGTLSAGPLPQGAGLCGPACLFGRGDDHQRPAGG
ncbi:sensor histidine kinase [Spirillospora sp. CA-294931]|uniref:sensor histidine kinase n=1 Tax=Spirillospora sp. CA-294931 TaxID=3240042 RepID=UPI003D8DA503